MNENSTNGMRSDIRHIEEDVKDLVQRVNKLETSGCFYKEIATSQIQGLSREMSKIKEDHNELRFSVYKASVQAAAAVAVVSILIGYAIRSIF